MLSLVVAGLSLSGLPRVIPLDPISSRSILHGWQRSCPDQCDPERTARLRRMCRFVSHASDSRGSVALVGPDGYVVAIATVAHPPLTLVDIDAPVTHASCAPVLLRALLRAAPDLCVSESLDDRWRIACCMLRLPPDEG